MAASIQVTRLLQAIQAFEQAQPRDLPQGVMEALGEIKGELAGLAPENASPGAREAAKLSPDEPPIKGSTSAGSPATGTHFSRAAKHADTPSPGQRAASLSAEIQHAASQIVERAR